jgi:hypothetical protein
MTFHLSLIARFNFSKSSVIVNADKSLTYCMSAYVYDIKTSVLTSFTESSGSSSSNEELNTSKKMWVLTKRMKTGYSLIRYPLSEMLWFRILDIFGFWNTYIVHFYNA